MAKTVLDRLIGYFSPKAGAQRAAYRMAIENLDGVRRYEGASRRGRLQGWNAPSTDANTEIAADLQILRNRSRDVCRNTAIGAAIPTKHADYIVGTGIMPIFKCDNPKVVEELTLAFDRWSKAVDPEGRMDYFGQQYHACRQMVEGGEAFARARTRRVDDPLAVPLQIQFLEPDMVDHTRTERTNRGKIVNGVEYDSIGRRRGYWVYDEHPGSSISSVTTAKFVKSSVMMHLYDPQRSQNRGVPWMHGVLVEIKDLHEYNQAELVRKKIESCNVAIAVRKGADAAEYEDPLGIRDGLDGTAVTDADGNAVERFEPGMIVYAKNTDDIRFNTPAISAGIEAYIRTCEKRISAGVRLPYELITGDYSDSNFASGKLALQAYYKFVSNFQWHYFIPQWCEPSIRWFIDTCRLTGLIPEDVIVDVDWHPPELESINRLEDAKADLYEVRIGKRSPQSMIAKTGASPEKVLREIVEWNAAVDAVGVVLDSDPRNMSMNGQKHGSDTTNDQGDGGDDAKPEKPAKKPPAKPAAKPAGKPPAPK